MPGPAMLRGGGCRPDGPAGRNRQLELQGCERDLLDVALQGEALLFEIGDGEAAWSLQGERLLVQVFRLALFEHADEALLHAVALAERDHVIE